MIEPPYGKPWALYGLLAASLTLNLVMVLDRPSSEASPDLEFEPMAVAAPAATDAASTGPAPQPVVTPEVAPSVVPAEVPALEGYTRVDASVEGSLARTFQSSVGEDGDALSAVFARLFMFDLDMRKDMQRGDRVVALYRKDAAGKIEIEAASLQSQQLGKTLMAFRWQAPGDEFARYWTTDATEAAPRLVDGPLADYEQITSLLKDRPSHKGMDFKATEGTAVLSPRAGRVERTNWNWSANGDCVEVRYDDGTLAKFLHLSKVQVRDGQRVAAGATIALSGNTGHSTAPHLHYQLEREGKTVDPVDYHGTWRREVPDAARADFAVASERATSRLMGELASR